MTVKVVAKMIRTIRYHAIPLDYVKLKGRAYDTLRQTSCHVKLGYAVS